jgi:thiol-disulfide isomerase/thioredoxin
MARAEIVAKQLGSAESYATQTESMALQLLQKRTLDAEPHLPVALGAARDVRAQVLAARGQHAQAVALLRKSIATYSATSIKPRLQKNLNLLTLTGTTAPALHEADFLGSKPTPLAQLKGMPVLLFFWAHWCGDCKAEGPIIAQLRSEFGPKGLAVFAPTQLYGYAARGEDATPQAERTYIEQVWNRFYPALQGVPVPISKENFSSYGASTTPTLVLLDRSGKVALYHPGVMPYDELRGAIQQAVGN